MAVKKIELSSIRYTEWAHILVGENGGTTYRVDITSYAEYMLPQPDGKHTYFMCEKQSWSPEEVAIHATCRRGLRHAAVKVEWLHNSEMLTRNIMVNQSYETKEYSTKDLP